MQDGPHTGGQPFAATGIDASEVAQWEQSAARGDVAAVARLGQLSLKIMEQAAERGNPEACCTLGQLLLQDENCAPSNTSRALRLLEHAALQDNTQAQYQLGAIFLHGEVVPADPAKGTDFLEQSKLQGNAMAQCELGVCYFNGEGTTNHGPCLPIVRVPMMPPQLRRRAWRQNQGTQALAESCGSRALPPGCPVRASFDLPRRHRGSARPRQEPKLNPNSVPCHNPELRESVHGPCQIPTRIRAVELWELAAAAGNSQA